MAVKNVFEVERNDELNRASIFTVCYQDKENKRKTKLLSYLVLRLISVLCKVFQYMRVFRAL